MADLKTEITDDPLVRGYSGMTDQQVADDMNTAYRSRNREVMTGDEIFQNIESKAIWDGLTNQQRLEFLGLCGRDEIDPFSNANVNVVKSVFGNPSDTVTNLTAARVESITRAVELGLPFVKAGHVAVARAE